MSTKTHVTPCLLVIFIDVSATRLNLFTSRHGVIYQDSQIFYLTYSYVFTNKYQFTTRSVLCAWNRLATGIVGIRRAAFSRNDLRHQYNVCLNTDFKWFFLPVIVKIWWKC